MQATFHLPESLPEDLRRFQEQVERLKSGAISAAEFRAFRVPQGVYEQREGDTYMLRVRFPAGVLLPHQMRALAAVSRRYGNGILHLTTRQDIQVHRVLLDDLHPALVELYAAGLSTKGGGGNTVRNITGCPHAGVCTDEAFDVSPWVVGVTEFLLPDPMSFQLPRKYKIAFSGCPNDCAGATVNDLGFVARRRNGSAGFAVHVGGGMGAASRVADPFDPFVPADEVHLVAEAVKRVFDQHGNRRNRHKARLRFLIEQIGLARFRELYEAELAALRKSNQAKLAPSERQADPCPSSLSSAATSQPGGRFALWQERSVSPQKQAEYGVVEISTVLGDVEAERCTALAGIVERYGERVARTTQRHNLRLRWVHRDDLPALHAELEALGFAGDEASVLRQVVACKGASTCRLGICLSRELAKALRSTLSASGLNLDEFGDLRIHISGCPNACGRHPIADVGLFGAARRVHGWLVPHYVLQLGGKVAEGQTRLAEGQWAIPAKSVPSLVADLLRTFRGSCEFPDFAGFLEALGDRIAGLASQHAEVPDFHADKSYYSDWGADEMFSLAGRGPGECGAGVFDLIEVDLQSAREALGQDRFFEATLLAARALLVTRGQQAQDESEALDLFARFFVDEKLVDQSSAALVEKAKTAARAGRGGGAFRPDAGEVTRFVEAIQSLYDNMDSSLRFKPAPETPAPRGPAPAKTPPAIRREADFRGVVCPLNYVKTKLLLQQIAKGDVLAVLLDADGAKSVPESVQKDGHDVLATQQDGTHWRVLIGKA